MAERVPGVDRRCTLCVAFAAAQHPGNVGKVKPIRQPIADQRDRDIGNTTARAALCRDASRVSQVLDAGRVEAERRRACSCLVPCWRAYAERRSGQCSPIAVARERRLHRVDGGDAALL